MQSLSFTSMFGQFENKLKENIHILSQIKPIINYYEPQSRQVQTQTYQMFDDYQEGFRCLKTCKKSIINQEILKQVNETMIKKIKEQFVKTKSDHIQQLMKRVKFLQQKILQDNKNKEKLIQKLLQKDKEIQRILNQQNQLKSHLAQKAIQNRNQIMKNKNFQIEIQTLKQEIQELRRKSSNLTHSIEQKQFIINEDQENLKRLANNQVLRTTLLNQISEQDKHLSFRLQENTKELERLKNYIQQVQIQLNKVQIENINLKNKLNKLYDQFQLKDQLMKEMKDQINIDKKLLENYKFIEIAQKKFKKYLDQVQFQEKQEIQNNKLQQKNVQKIENYLEKIVLLTENYVDTEMEHMNQIIFAMQAKYQQTLLSQKQQFQMKEEQLKRLIAFTKAFYQKKSTQWIKKSQKQSQRQLELLKSQIQQSALQYEKQLQKEYDQMINEQKNHFQSEKQLMHNEKKQLQRQIQKLYQEMQQLRNQNQIFKHLLQTKEQQKKNLRLKIQELEIKLQEEELSNQIRIKQMGMLKEKNNELRKSSIHQRSAIRLPSFGGEDNLITDKLLLSNGLSNSNNNKDRETVISSSQTPTFNRSSLDENVFEFANIQSNPNIHEYHEYGSEHQNKIQKKQDKIVKNSELGIGFKQNDIIPERTSVEQKSSQIFRQSSKNQCEQQKRKSKSVQKQNQLLRCQQNPIFLSEERIQHKERISITVGNNNEKTEASNIQNAKQSKMGKQKKKLTIQADTSFRRLDLPRSPQYSSKKVQNNNQNRDIFQNAFNNNNEKYIKNARLLNDNKLLHQKNKHLMIQIQKMTQYIYNLHNIGSNWRKIQKDKEKLHKFDSCLRLPQKLAELIHKKEQINNELQNSCNTSQSSTQIKSIITELDKIINETNKWVTLFQGINKKQIQRHDKLLSRIKLKKTKTLVQKHQREIKQDCYETSKCFAVDKQRDIYSQGMSPGQECDFQFQFSPFDMDPTSKHRDNSLEQLFNQGPQLSQISSVKNQSQISQFINSRSQFVNMFDPKNFAKVDDFQEIHPNFVYAYHDFQSNHQPSLTINQTNSVPQKSKVKNQSYQNCSIKSLRHICNKQKQKTKVLQKKLIDTKVQYKKLIEKILDANKKKITKLQKDFNNSMNFMIKSIPCNKNSQQESNTKQFIDQIIQINKQPSIPTGTFERKISRHASKSMSLVDINIPKRISETQEIVQQKIQQIQQKLDTLRTQYQEKQTLLHSKIEQCEQLQKKLKQQKIITEKLNQKFTHQKEKTNQQKVRNKRIKNQFNEFMLKLSQKNLEIPLLPPDLIHMTKSSYSSRTKTGQTQTQASYLKKMNSIEVQYHEESQNVQKLKTFVNQLIQQINQYHFLKNTIHQRCSDLRNINQMFPIFKQFLRSCIKLKIQENYTKKHVHQLQYEVLILKQQVNKKQQALRIQIDKQKQKQTQMNISNIQSLQNLQKAILSLRKTAQDAENKNKQLKYQNEKLAQNLSQLISSYNDRERVFIELHESQKRYSQLKKNNSVAQEKIQVLLIQNQSLNNQKTQFLQEISKKDKQIKEMSISIKNSTEKIMILENHQRQLQQKIHNYEVQEVEKHQNLQKRHSSKSKVSKKNSNGSIGSIGSAGDQFFQFEDQKQFNNILEQKTLKVEQLTKQNEVLKQKYEKLKNDTKPFTEKHHKTIFLEHDKK